MEIDKSKLEELLKTALILAKQSPDPSTQNAALLVEPETYKVLTGDVNRFPEGVFYNDDRWQRPLKYSIVEHAERNCIYSASKQGIKTEGKILVCPWFACADCARGIIQAGIKTAVGLPRTWENTNPRWKETCDIADMMLDEAGVQRLYLDVKAGIDLLRDGKYKQF